jgi:hypothetical protein
MRCVYTIYMYEHYVRTVMWVGNNKLLCMYVCTYVHIMFIGMYVCTYVRACTYVIVNVWSRPH